MQPIVTEDLVVFGTGEVAKDREQCFSTGGL